MRWVRQGARSLRHRCHPAALVQEVWPAGIARDGDTAQSAGQDPRRGQDGALGPQARRGHRARDGGPRGKPAPAGVGMALCDVLALCVGEDSRDESGIGQRRGDRRQPASHAVAVHLGCQPRLLPVLPRRPIAGRNDAARSGHETGSGLFRPRFRFPGPAGRPRRARLASHSAR